MSTLLGTHSRHDIKFKLSVILKTVSVMCVLFQNRCPMDQISSAEIHILVTDKRTEDLRMYLLLGILSVCSFDVNFPYKVLFILYILLPLSIKREWSLCLRDHHHHHQTKSYLQFSGHEKKSVPGTTDRNAKEFLKPVLNLFI